MKINTHYKVANAAIASGHAAGLLLGRGRAGMYVIGEEVAIASQEADDRGMPATTETAY